jgi:NTP pyrophosphatase (non-canonical NTP hydrolase)
MGRKIAIEEMKPEQLSETIVMWYDNLSEANIERNKYWDSDSKLTLSFRGNELAGEVGEACNVVKKIERERLGLRGSRATKEQLAEELADVVICADLLAMEAGIDLSKKVAEKFNATSDKYNLPVKMKTT